ncbi:MAG: DUF2791 family P-loop domain-containing protein [Thermoplasmata archaeon]
MRLIGMRVYHSKYGEGIIKRVRCGGYELEVEFNGLTKWLCIDEINILQEGDSNKITQDKMQSEGCENEQFSARRLIESLRLGIVPLDQVKKFTFGRKRETEKIEKWLGDSNPANSTLFLMGEYGAGKTHLLHHTIASALENGYATAWIEVGGGELCNPKTVYKNLMRNFRYPTQNGRIGEFQEFVTTMIRDGDFEDNYYFRCLKPRMDDSAVWEWIGGWDDRPKPYPYGVYPPMHSDTKSANIYCYLISTLGWASKHVLGLRGLLLVFDEMETITSAPTAPQRAASRNFLEALIKTSMDFQNLKENPSNSGLCYSRRSYNIPFIYKTPTSLKLMFSLPSDWRGIFRDRRYHYIDMERDTQLGFSQILPACREIAEIIMKSEKILLEPLPVSEMGGIIIATNSFYQVAYNVEPLSNSEIEKMFLKGTGAINMYPNGGIRIRNFVKWCVEYLDLKRFRGG